MSTPLLYLDTSAWLKLYVEETGSDLHLNESAAYLGMQVLIPTARE